MVRSADETAHGDFVQDICFSRDGFQAILHILNNQDHQIMMVVEAGGHYTSPANNCVILPKPAHKSQQQSNQQQYQQQQQQKQRGKDHQPNH